MTFRMDYPPPSSGGAAGVSTFNGRDGDVLPVAGDYSSFGAMLSVSHASGTYSVDATGYGGIIAGATTGAGITINGITGIPAGRYFIIDIDSESIGTVTLLSESFGFGPLEVNGPTLLYTSDGVLWNLVFGTGGVGFKFQNNSLVGLVGGETIGNAVQGVSGVFTDKLATSATGNAPSVTAASQAANITIGSITGTDFAGRIAFSASDEAGPGVLFGIDFAITKTNQPNVKVYPLNADWATNAGGTQPYASVRADGSGFDIVVGKPINAGSYLIGYDVIDEVNLAATGGA